MISREFSVLRQASIRLQCGATLLGCTSAPGPDPDVPGLPGPWPGPWPGPEQGQGRTRARQGQEQGRGPERGFTKPDQPAQLPVPPVIALVHRRNLQNPQKKKLVVAKFLANVSQKNSGRKRNNVGGKVLGECFAKVFATRIAEKWYFFFLLLWCNPVTGPPRLTPWRSQSSLEPGSSRRVRLACSGPVKPSQSRTLS